MDRVAIDDGELETAVLGSGDPVAPVPTALTADELLPLAERLRGRFQVAFTTTGGAMPAAARPGRPVPSLGTRLTAHDCWRRSPSRVCTSSLSRHPAG
jgi:hypothetical protein